MHSNLIDGDDELFLKIRAQAGQVELANFSLASLMASSNKPSALCIATA